MSYGDGTYTIDGRFTPPLTDEQRKMDSPVRCQCGAIYDLLAVHVTHHYADCSVWKAPCCGVETDDRPGSRNYTKVAR